MQVRYRGTTVRDESVRCRRLISDSGRLRHLRGGVLRQLLRPRLKGCLSAQPAVRSRQGRRVPP